MQMDHYSEICNMDMKRQLFRHCKNMLQDRVQRARESYRDAQEAAEEETKSSAGDKYESGRAMMLMEMEKHGQYLTESMKLLQAKGRT